MLNLIYLLDEIEWKSHFFVLTHNKIFYSEVNNESDDGDGDSLSNESGMARNSSVLSNLSTQSGQGGFDMSELHFSEAWFHGNLERGRETAENMLMDNAHMGDGTFIVRRSQTFIGDYSLSFLRKGKVRGSINFDLTLLLNCVCHRCGMSLSSLVSRKMEAFVIIWSIKCFLIRCIR